MLVFFISAFLHSCTFLQFQLGYSIGRAELGGQEGAFVHSCISSFLYFFCIFNKDVLVFGRAELGGQEGGCLHKITQTGI